MRRPMTFLLALTLAFSLSGCGAEGETEVPSVVSVEEERLPVRERDGERLLEIQESGVLMIGISPDYAPFAFKTEEDGEEICAGSDVELGKYIAQELGVEVVFIEGEFEDCLRSVGAGEVDLVLLGMLKKPEREKYVDFTEEYYRPGRQVVIVKKESAEDYATLDELAGKTVAAQYGSLQAQLIAEQLPESYIELADNAKGSVNMLLEGLADAAVFDEAAAEEVLKEHSELALAGAELVYEGEAVAGGTVKGEEEFLEAVNTILKEAAEKKLYLEWLDAATEQAASLAKAGASPQSTP